MVAIGKKPDAIEFIVAWTNCTIFDAEEVVEKICLAEEYKRKHQTELNTYKVYRDTLKSMIVEPDKKINPKAWTKELDGLKESYRKTERPLSDAIVDLAKMEVLKHNKRDLERMLQNERSERNRTHIRNRDQIL